MRVVAVDYTHHTCGTLINQGHKVFNGYGEYHPKKFDGMLMMCPTCFQYSLASKDGRWSRPIPQELIDEYFKDRPNYPDKLGNYLMDYWFKRDWESIFLAMQIQYKHEMPWMSDEECKAIDKAWRDWIKESIIACGAPMHYAGLSH